MWIDLICESLTRNSNGDKTYSSVLVCEEDHLDESTLEEILVQIKVTDDFIAPMVDEGEDVVYLSINGHWDLSHREIETVEDLKAKLNEIYGD